MLRNVTEQFLKWYRLPLNQSGETGKGGELLQYDTGLVWCLFLSDNGDGPVRPCAYLSLLGSPRDFFYAG